ncbi:MAG: ABC transporter permease [Microthrixaceae bacterium]
MGRVRGAGSGSSADRGGAGLGADCWQASLQLRAMSVRSWLVVTAMAGCVAALVVVTGLNASSGAALLADLDAPELRTFAVPCPQAAARLTCEDVAAGVALVVEVERSGAVEEVEGGRPQPLGWSSYRVAGGAAAEFAPMVRVEASLLDGGLPPDSMPDGTLVFGRRLAERSDAAVVAELGQLQWGTRRYAVVNRSVSSSLVPEIDHSLVAPVDELSGPVGPASTRRYVLLAESGTAGSMAAALRAVLSPNAPTRLQIDAPPDRTDLIDRVAGAQAGLGQVLLVAVVAMSALVTSALTGSQVMERRGLIGMKRLIGASRTNIVRQVLVETALLSACGSLIGVAAGLVVCRGVAAVRGWPAAVPGPVLWQASAAAITAALLGATFPAWRAASIDPTVAISEG